MALAKIKVTPAKFNPFIKDFRHPSGSPLAHLGCKPRPQWSHYYHVHFFENKEEMWLAGAKLSPWEKDKNGGYGALTLPTWRYRYEGEEQITAPKVGNVLFYKGCLGSECISHEAVHMATSYLQLINQLALTEQIDENEEKLAYCIGSCTRQIVDNLYKLKVL